MEQELACPMCPIVDSDNQVLLNWIRFACTAGARGTIRGPWINRIVLHDAWR